MSKSQFLLWISFFIFSFSWAIEPSLGKIEREKINECLQIQSITEKELGFEKKWAWDSIYRLKIVTQLLDQPLQTPDYLDKSINEIDNFKDKIVNQLSFLSNQIDLEITHQDLKKLDKEIELHIKTGIHIKPGLHIKTSRNLISKVNTILASYECADKYLRQSIRNLSRSEIDKLLMMTPVLWSDEEDTLSGLKGALHREFGIEIDTSKKIEIDTILELFTKIDRKALALSGLAVAMGIENVMPDLGKIFFDSLPKFNVDGIIGSVYFYQETKWGKIVIGSEEDNVYYGNDTFGNDKYRARTYKNYALIIDIGGDDKYQARIGSAIGILSNPFSVVIDLEGNDLYDTPEKLFNFGAALIGCGILIDKKGNDTYRSFHNSLGAGLLGTGVLLDYEGDDIYSAGCFSEGAGNLGVGMLTDIKGNDKYYGYENCQAFSSTWGYGLLTDFDGNDLYYAGGKYLHKPLLPNDYRTLSQGFSIGFRPTASGGIALLYDKSGQDYYNGSVYAQGTSYWYSLGMLYDKEGNDFYNATQYSQGAGIHLSIGILVDRSGNDHYFSRFGPAQGEGHDFSVGILIDKKGNDYYVTSGGQGIGLTNSLGLFIDNEGDDIYTTKEKYFGQGMANWSRGFGGIGVFLDLQGDDKYPRESFAENNTNWTQSVYGFGIDIKGKPRDLEAEIQEEPDTIKLITGPIEDVFKEASLWEVGSAKKRVRAGRKELLKRGEQAINYIFDKKIATKDGLELRAIEELTKSIQDTSYPDTLIKNKLKKLLYQSLYHKDRWARSNSAYLLGKIKAIDAIDSLILAYHQKRIRARAMIGAFEDIGDSSIVPIIIPYLKDKEEPTRIASARALAKLKDPRAIPALYNALNDRFFTVRMSAESALVSIGDSSLKFLLTKTNDPKILGVIGVLGAKLDTIEKKNDRAQIINIIKPYLEHSNPSVRLKAVEVLSQFKEAKLILQEKMAIETNEFVIKKYQEILK
ncbi:MAG: HEAT repeat domain-containing protein [candidate division WOR-3 bacterium]|nr:HEAT repeat domain-containing protein [candidate division WOR-3 bacterium]